MKRTVFIVVSLMITLNLLAQMPQKMSYQAVVRNAGGNLITNAGVSFRISIIADSTTGTVVYSETHDVVTNENGLATFEIGGGNVLNGSFDLINWADGVFFLKVEVDPAGGTDYNLSATSQLLAVPYAFHAQTADSVDFSGLTNAPDFAGWDTLESDDVKKLDDLEDVIYNDDNSLFLGEMAGANMDTSYSHAHSVAVGYKALNIGGSYSVAVGYGALQNNSSSSNTAVGVNAMGNSTGGYFNVAIGPATLYENVDGAGSIAIGYLSLSKHKTGNDNVAVGCYTLYNDTVGEYNTAIGHYAYYSGNYHNSTAIGYQAVITADNMIRLGNSNVTSIGGHSAWTNTSDGRFKRNVKENIPGLAFITKLRPVSYTWDLDSLDSFLGVKHDDKYYAQYSKERKEQEKIVHTGFIAQEVEAAAKEAGFDFDGVYHPANEKDIYGIAYGLIVVPLVKAVQEQQEIIEKQNDKINELEKRLEELEKLVKNKE